MSRHQVNHYKSPPPTFERWLGARTLKTALQALLLPYF